MFNENPLLNLRYYILLLFFTFISCYSYEKEMGGESWGYWYFSRVLNEDYELLLLGRSPLYTLYLQMFNWLPYPTSVRIEYIISTLITLVSIVTLLMIFTAFFSSLSILGLLPIIDFLTNELPDKTNQVSKAVNSYYNYWNIPVNIFTLGIFFLSLILVKNLFTILEGFIRTRTIMQIMKKIIFQTYGSFLNASWSFFGSKQYGTLANTVTKETEKATIAFESLAGLVASSFSLIFYSFLLFFISWELLQDWKNNTFTTSERLYIKSSFSKFP